MDGFIHKEANEILIKPIDSLKYPFSDFAERALQTEVIEEAESCPRLFLIAGLPAKVRALKKGFDRQLKHAYNELATSDQLLEAVDTNIQHLSCIPSLELWFLLCLQELCCGDTLKFPLGEYRERDGVGLMFYFGSNGPNDDKSAQVESMLNLWWRREEPRLKGFQCQTRSFSAREYVSGRRVLGILPDSEDDTWGMLLEGGVIVPLVEDFDRRISVMTSKQNGLWSDWEVSEIFSNPVNAFGVLFEPYDLFQEWQYVLQYCLATLPISKYTLEQLELIYSDFCDMIASEVCFKTEDVPQILGKTEFMKLFEIQIQTLRLYLRGTEEANVSKNIIFMMRSRYAYLPVMYGLLAAHFPGEVEARLDSDDFDGEEWRRLLQQSAHETDANRKGRTFEELAAYFFNTISGLQITGRRQRRSREEVDAYCCNVSFDPQLWQLGPLILVECKNRITKFRASDVRKLVPTMDAKGIQAAVAFSAAGFTSSAMKEIRHQLGSRRLIIPIGPEELYSLSEICTPYDLLIEKIRVSNLMLNEMHEF
jgi:hypothetical protein